MNQLDPRGEQHQVHYAGQELRYDRRDHALSQPARDPSARSSVVATENSVRIENADFPSLSELNPVGKLSRV
jgi:hypothetical protein